MIMANNNNKDKCNVPNLRFPEFSGEWEMSSIGEQFELYSGNTPSRMNKNQFDGSINWITSGELKEHYISDTKEKISEEAAKNNSLKLLPVGTFVIAIYGLEANGVRGTCSITTRESTISQACMAFTSKMDIQNEFLYSWYKKHGNIIGIKYAQGTKQQNLSYDIIERFNISYPCMEEQKKLIRFISLIDQRIATQNKIIEDLKKLKSAISERLFNAIKGDVVVLEDIGDVVKGKQINGEFLSESGKYYVMNGGIEPSGFYNDYNVEANTISISEGGNSCGYVQFNACPFWSGGHCYTIQNTTDNVKTEYLYQFLKSKESEIMKLRIGSGLPNIQKKDLAKFKITIPNISEQKVISAFLSSFERKADVEMNFVNLLLEEKQYLLRQMFI
ncbi:restriction endonuclease subunit S [Bacteroides xylanisolvens]|jgi:type I restriction enzyme S subunit|nr:restriction endonuclease subunit S [Bacteroides xylanisolvens]KAB6233067.1 restriction endonuclease subunit S [Bacteroides xylanisolvens]KAB6280118.1 restriction endonuclease subunit S [Bacteroides xylanisolvens]KAB6296490.1 restriction endonuclease subunit S [Bacteroides xylanisolvens]KAB6351835.1 restriction endonuclease subunit S [Bacteroides xylanisolvens]